LKLIKKSDIHFINQIAFINFAKIQSESIGEYIL